MSKDAAPAVLIAGRYQILAHLGSGAMGTVYRVRDLELDEVVALKLLRHEFLGSGEILERFRREVKLARLVTHRNVARTFDIGEHQGERFLTMEHLSGRSLAARLSVGPVPIVEALTITQEICAGLAAAHSAGVVHRDLKPENIMLCDDGRVVITDFGIARGLAPAAEVAGGPRTTQQTVGMVGTPAYMAPEQVDQSAAADARSDLYALGCMMFELFTGRLPWQGSTVTELLLPRLVKEPPDPRGVRPELPDTVARVILRCLARSPALRPASASEVATALQTTTLPLSADALLEVARPLPGTERPAPVPPALGDTIASPPPWLPGTSGGGASLATHLADPRAVAVLPFHNGGPTDDDYLATGLTEDLIDSLSVSRELRVRPHGAVRAYRGPDRDPRQVGCALGVAVVIEGSLRRSGDSLRVQVRVLNVEDGFQIWARRFERPPNDLWAVSEDMADGIVDVLTAKRPELKREGPRDPQVLDLYLRARHEFHEPDRVHTLRAAALFEQALAQSPADPVLLSGYALSRARLWFFGGEGAAELARAAAQQAMTLAPERGESHLAQGVVRYQSADYAGAVRDLREALRRAPALAEAYDHLGRILVESGPLLDGMRHLHDALGLEPALAGARIALARSYALQGQWDQADKLLEQHEGPSDRGALWMTRARLCQWRGNAAAAQRLLAHPDLGTGRFPAVAALLELMRGGTAASALAALGPLFPQNGSERSRAFLLQIETEIHCQAGDHDSALATLRRVLTTQMIDLVWLERCPALNALRGDARYPPLRAAIAARVAPIHAALSA